MFDANSWIAISTDRYSFEPTTRDVYCNRLTNEDRSRVIVFEHGDRFYGKDCMLFVDIVSENDYAFSINILHSHEIIHKIDLIPSTTHYSFHKFLHIGEPTKGRNTLGVLSNRNLHCSMQFVLMEL
jgi:hypothetical protein